MSEDEKREDYNFDQGCPDPTSLRGRTLRVNFRPRRSNLVRSKDIKVNGL